MSYEHHYQPQQTYPRKRRIWPWVLAAVAISLCLASAIAALASGDPQTANPGTSIGIAGGKAAVSAAPKVTGKAEPATVRGGIWEVPGEVKPGTYTTTADDHCYWARLKNFDGELDSINANGNIDPGQRGRIVVKRSDKGLELRGDCVWKAAK